MVASAVFAHIFNLMHAVVFVLLSADFFCKIFYFSNNSFWSTIIVSNCCDPDQAFCFVWPDLGPNCLHSLGQIKKNTCVQGNPIIPKFTGET